MRVRESGSPSSPPVLLLHGQALDGRVYDALAARLGPRFRVLVPDLPGYGESPLPVPYGIAAVHERIRDALAERGVVRPAVVGYSFGAYHALALALGGLETRGIALLGPLAGLDGPARAAFRGYADAVRAGARLGRMFAENALPAAFTSAHPGVVERVASLVDLVSPDTAVAEFLATADLPDLRGALPRLRAPLLLRVGDADRMTPPDLAREMAALVNGARLEVVPGVGHHPLLQDARATEESIERFLLADLAGTAARRD